MLIQAPKGTRDVLPHESRAWQDVERVMRNAAALAGYREIRTPVFEHTELFSRGVGDTTDIVQKEMYTFQDKGERSITLKPEGTAGAVRCFLEHGLQSEPLPCKMYYLNAPVFRYEAPQKGRLREHHQFGMECFGAAEATADAELVIIACNILKSLEIPHLDVHINSIGCPDCRKLYHDRLREYLAGKLSGLCDVCKQRFDRNPLRVLDCKVEKCRSLLTEAPSIIDVLCDDCRKHFESVLCCLDEAGISYKIDNRIVRGLDYYTRTVFEIITESDGDTLTVCGGGRYDKLISQLGGSEIPAVGFGMGIERILMLQHPDNNINMPICDVFVTFAGEHRIDAFKIVQVLRNEGIRADMDHCGRSLKAQFKYANKTGALLVLTVGDDEVADGTVRIKDMSTGEDRTAALINIADTVNVLADRHSRANA